MPLWCSLIKKGIVVCVFVELQVGLQKRLQLIRGHVFGEGLIGNMSDEMTPLQACPPLH